jgi:mono/diheme cytochrome c family protein
MVRSDDGKHKVIKEACSVCHKDELFEFLIMIYSTKRLTPAGDGSGKGKAAAEKKPEMAFAPTETGKINFHQGINCLFCHQKGADNKPIGDKFISMDGKVSSLCTLCHTNVNDFHFISKKRISTDEILVLLKGYGLKVNDDGTINCVTCHTVHSKKAFGDSLNEGFRPFLVNSTYFSPHGSSISCIACHKERPEPKKKITFISYNKEDICRKCHKADIEGHHVTEVSSSKNSYIMDFLDVPLYDDKVFCPTCHDEVCYKKTDPQNKKFLIYGPYKNKEEFCNICHKREISDSENPHKQIDKEGNIEKKQCAICHEKLPKQGDKDIVLVSSALALCSKCHKIFDHPDTNHLVEMQGTKLKNLRNYEEVYKITFPLDDDGEVTCVTCHNPHDKGVLKGLAGVGAGEYMSLRGVSFEEACTPCHGKIY